MSPSEALRSLNERLAEIVRARAGVRAEMKQAKKPLANAARPSKRHREQEAAKAVERVIPIPDRTAVLEEFWRQATRGKPCGSEVPGERMGEPCAAEGITLASEAPPLPGEVDCSWSTKRARSFTQEWRLHEWVLKQNEVGGQAPCGPQLWAAWRGLAAGASNVREGLIAAPHGISRRGKQWVRRWARRWRLLRGRPRPGPALTVEQLQAKVTAGPTPTPDSEKSVRWREFPGPKRCPKSGPW